MLTVICQRVGQMYCRHLHYFSSILQTTALHSPRIYLYINKTTRRHIPQDDSPHSYCSYITFISCPNKSYQNTRWHGRQTKSALHYEMHQEADCTKHRSDAFNMQRCNEWSWNFQNLTFIHFCPRLHLNPGYRSQLLSYFLRRIWNLPWRTKINAFFKL